MTQEEVIEYFEDASIEDALIFENPDYANAFIGHSDDNRAVYSYDHMIKCLMEEENMTEEDAIEHINFNTLRSIPYAGERAPIVIYLRDDLRGLF